MDLLHRNVEDSISTRNADAVLSRWRALGRAATASNAEWAGLRWHSEPLGTVGFMSTLLAGLVGGLRVRECRNRTDGEQGSAVHGLVAEPDLHRAAVDLLMQHGDDGFDDAESEHLYGHGRSIRPQRSSPRRGGRLRLYTATILDSRDNVMIQAFHASMARTEREVRSRLVGRYGPDVADVADIRLGLPRASPIVLALVPDPIVELIRRTELDWASPDVRTFGVDIQQVIQA